MADTDPRFDEVISRLLIAGVVDVPLEAQPDVDAMTLRLIGVARPSLSESCKQVGASLLADINVFRRTPEGMDLRSGAVTHGGEWSRAAAFEAFTAWRHAQQPTTQAVHIDVTEEYGALHRVVKDLVAKPQGGFRALGAMQTILEEIIDGAPADLRASLREEVRERFKDKPMIVSPS